MRIFDRKFDHLQPVKFEPMTYKLLIVDDDAALSQMLTWTFEDLGYEVATALDGRSALQRLLDYTPDLVILDCQLPDGSGLDVLRRLKNLQPTLPIVMISAMSDSQIAHQARAEGVYAFLPKPVRTEELAITLRGALLAQGGQ